MDILSIVEDILVPKGTDELFQKCKINEDEMKRNGMTPSEILKKKEYKEKKATTRANCIALGRILLHCLGQNIQIAAHVLVS